VRSRRAILFGAITALAFDAALLGCSSDKPKAASVTPTDRDAEPNADATPSKDGGRDANDAADAPVDPVIDAGPCLDDKPAPTDGGAAPVCPTSGTCSAICDRIVDHYKLGVAQVAVTCILKLSSCSIPTDVMACVDGALGRACVDSTSKGYCTPLVKACDPNAGGPGSSIDEAGCESFANGFSSSGRTAFATCLQSKIDVGTCPTEVVACADEIRQ